MDMSTGRMILVAVGLIGGIVNLFETSDMFRARLREGDFATLGVWGRVGMFAIAFVTSVILTFVLAVVGAIEGTWFVIRRAHWLVHYTRVRTKLVFVLAVVAATQLILMWHRGT